MNTADIDTRTLEDAAAAREAVADRPECARCAGVGCLLDRDEMGEFVVVCPDCDGLGRTA